MPVDGGEFVLITGPTSGQITAFETTLGAPNGRQRYRVGDDETTIGLAAVGSEGLLGLLSQVGQAGGIKATIATIDHPQSTSITAELLRVARLAAADAGGEVELWTSGATEAEAEELARSGFVEARKLYQLRVDLPIADRPDITLDWRPFVPGQDEEGFLAVNGRAFVWHPEQGDMSPADLASAMVEPWFDPEGFVIHPVEGEIDGFCWTKVHPATTSPVTNPTLGEIYVIAVDPSAGGQGLGRKLVHTGLDHIVSQGITTGMLYVEADNEPALGLYRSMGFVEHTADQRWAQQPGANENNVGDQ